MIEFERWKAFNSFDPTTHSTGLIGRVGTVDPRKSREHIVPNADKQ